MKWIAISGSWRHTNEQIETEVRKTVREIMARGDGIVVGGALGVDFFATDEALKIDASKVCVFIPTTLAVYAAHYRKRATEGVITHEQAEALIAQLTELQQKNPNALVEDSKNTVLDKTTYFARNTSIVEQADELVAFHVNNTEGTQDTITKAKMKGIPVRIFSYTIDPEQL